MRINKDSIYVTSSKDEQGRIVQVEVFVNNNISKIDRLQFINVNNLELVYSIYYDDYFINGRRAILLSNFLDEIPYENVDMFKQSKIIKRFIEGKDDFSYNEVKSIALALKNSCIKKEEDFIF